MKLATSDYVLHAAEDGLDSLHQLVARHSEPESPVVGPDLLHQAAVHHLAHLLVRRARQVLSGGVVLHAKELVGLRDGRQAGSLVAEKGQSYVRRGKLHNDRRQGGGALWQARDSGLDLAHPDPVDIRDGVKLLWQNVNLFAGLGCSEHRFDQEVIDHFIESTLPEVSSASSSLTARPKLRMELPLDCCSLTLACSLRLRTSLLREVTFSERSFTMVSSLTTLACRAEKSSIFFRSMSSLASRLWRVGAGAISKIYGN